MGKYDDIINMEHHKSKKHPPMSMEDRAAQFSPFKALTGLDDEVDEKARVTDDMSILDENTKSILDERLREIICRMEAGEVVISITHFVPDVRKMGGEYVKTQGTLKKIDEISRCLILKGGVCIYMDNISNIEIVDE